jgi:hypothetical protein
MSEGEPKQLRPDQLSTRPISGRQLIERQLETLQPLLETHGKDSIKFLEDHPLLDRATTTFEGAEGLNGSMVFTKRRKPGEDGNVSVEFTGNLTEKGAKPLFPGEARGANWSGKFHRQADPNDPPFVKDGDIVKKGDIIGWAFLDKRNDGPVLAHATGQIHFALPDGAEVSEGTEEEEFQDATITHYIDETKGI